LTADSKNNRKLKRMKQNLIETYQELMHHFPEEKVKKFLGKLRKNPGDFCVHF